MIIATSCFTSANDPQRNVSVTDVANYVRKWCESVHASGFEGLLFHDCDMPDFPGVKTVRVEKSNSSPYQRRWFTYRSFLTDYANGETVFLTDVSDVIVNRFDAALVEPGILYCGDEEVNVGNPWMIKRILYYPPDVFNYFAPLFSQRLLNCGIAGGKASVVSHLVEAMCDFLEKYEVPPEATDMPAFNYVVLRNFLPDLFHGYPINSAFRAYQAGRKDVWFIHK